MPGPSEKEIARQYRVLQQTLSAHAALRDGYALKATVAEVILLVCAAIFCATTFAGNSFYLDLGVSPQTARLILGIASVFAFATSVALLVIDWSGSAARHGEAVEKWTSALEVFRKQREEDGMWAEEVQGTLSAAYWEADRNSTAIPEGSFNRLKARHLRKVEVSKLLSQYPGCPRLILTLVVAGGSTIKALKEARSRSKETDGVES